VLIVDDSPEDRVVLRQLLSRGNQRFEIRELATATAVLEAVRAGTDDAPDCILLDCHLPDADAPALLAALGGPDSLCCPVVVITGDCGADSGPALMRLGAQDFIGKEWMNAGSLARTVENAIERFALIRERSEQETRLRAFFDASDDAVGLFGEHGFLECNPATLKMFGCASPEELIGRDLIDISPRDQPDGRDSRALAQEHIAAAHCTGTHRFEWRLLRLDGTPFTADVVLTSVQVAGRRVLHACLRDITAQKAAEAEIRRLNAELTARVAASTAELEATIDQKNRAEGLIRRLAAIIEASGDLIATSTPAGEVDYMNRAGRTLLGIGAAESLFQTRIEHYHPAWAYRRVIDEGLPIALAEGHWLGDNAMLRRDGSEVPVSQLIIGHRDSATGEVEFISTICRDLSERFEAERALRRLQEEQALILDHMPAFILFKDTKNRVLRANAVAARDLGLRKDQIEGRSMTELLPEDADHFYRNDLAVISSGQPIFGIEESYQSPSGVGWTRTDLVPLTDDAGQVTRILVMAADVTERKQAEAALERIRDQLAEGQRIAHLGSWEYIAATQTTIWSDEQKRIFGLNPAEPSPDYAALLRHHIHPDDAPELDRRFQAVLANRIPFENENRIVLPDGTIRWIYNKAQPYFDETGHLLRYVGVALDITARKQAEESVRASEERYRRLHESLRDGFVEVDMTGRIIDSNKQYRRMLGYTAAELSELTYKDLTPERWHSFEEAIVRERIIPHGYSEVYEKEYRRRDGTVFPVELRTVLLRDAAGNPSGMWAIVRDITERKRAEEALQEADRRKDEFLATLAHELRNPLAPIRNGLTLLRQAGGDGASAESVRAMMERQVDHLVQLVDDLLEVSRITRDKIELRKARIVLSDVLGQALETSQPLIQAGAHRVTVTLPEEPLRLEADPSRLVQIFSNLLNNAAKYTDAGGQISITVERQGSEVAVSVRDTGIGIPAEMLPKVFDLFAQVDRTLGRAQGGLGIGLALVRRLVEMHGGRVDVHSDGAGQGSEFLVRLPLAAETTVEIESSTGSRSASAGILAGRLLVVDDSRDAADTLVLLLQSSGAKVEVAYDGPTALKAIAEFQPFAVLLDLGMPGMDGYEVAHRIRELPGGPEITLIALTGWGQDEDRRRTREAGFDHHLVKPVNFRHLQTLLRSLGRVGQPAKLRTP